MFENADHVAAGHADSLFRHLSTEATMWTGDDQTVGWVVSMLYVSRLDIARYAAREGDPWATEQRNVPPGWYLIKVDSLGLIWAHFYGESLPKCSADFSAAETEFIAFEEARNV